MRTVRKLLWVVAGSLAAFTAVVGFAHTRPGRPLLAYMPWAKAAEGLCPLGYDAPATAEARAAARQNFALAHRGQTPAPARPALGFALDQTSRQNVMAWARAKGLSCATPKRGHDIECENVPAYALPAASEGARSNLALRNLWLDFGGKGELVSVIAVRGDEHADEVVKALATFRSNVAGTGADNAVQTSLEADKAELQAGLLRQSVAEYKFTDYYALARATHMPNGFVLTEQYRSLPPETFAMAGR